VLNNINTNKLSSPAERSEGKGTQDEPHLRNRSMKLD